MPGWKSKESVRCIEASGAQNPALQPERCFGLSSAVLVSTSTPEQIAFSNCPKVQVICELALTTAPWQGARTGLQLWRRAFENASLLESRVARLTYLLDLGFGSLSLGLRLPGFAARLGGRSHPRSVLLGDAQPGRLDWVNPGTAGVGVLWGGAGRYPSWAGLLEGTGRARSGAGGLSVPHSTLPS